MARTLKIAACQLAAHDRADLVRAWPHVRERIREAAGTGAQLVVLPEGTLPAYVLGREAFAASEIAVALEECSALARDLRVTIVMGAARRERDRTFNSAVIIDADGSVAGHADKHFL